MDLDPKRKAQQRADRIAAFRAELAELGREQGLILTSEQQARLDAHLQSMLASLAGQYGADVSESAKRISWGLRLVVLLGGIAFCAAIVLFLHRVWGALPSSAHALILVALPLLLLAAAELVSRRRVDLYYPALLALAAGIGFVMELNALGGTFNMVPSAHALLAWAAFALLVAYAYGLRLLLAAGLVLTSAYSAALWLTAVGGYWAGIFDRAGFLLPAAAVLYAIPWLVRDRDRHDFNFVYRMCGAAMALLALLILSKRGDLCCSGLPARTLEAFYQLAGLVLSVGVAFHGLHLGRSGLVNLGAGAFVVFLFVRLHAWWWDWMPKYLFFLLLSLIAVLLLVPFLRLRRRLSERAMP
jgi:hypothetical protein